MSTVYKRKKLNYEKSRFCPSLLIYCTCCRFEGVGLNVPSTAGLSISQTLISFVAFLNVIMLVKFKVSFPMIPVCWLIY